MPSAVKGEHPTPRSVDIHALLRSFFILFPVPFVFVAPDFVQTVLLTRHAR